MNEALRQNAQLLSAISSQNVVFNRVLKRLSGKIGLTFGLTFHSNRHTFADLARVLGWPVYDISKALHHASLKTTERCMKRFDQDAIDEPMGSLHWLLTDLGLAIADLGLKGLGLPTSKEDKYRN